MSDPSDSGYGWEETFDTKGADYDPDGWEPTEIDDNIDLTDVPF